MNVREQAYKLKAEGKTYGEIAQILGISKSTAHKYVKQYERELKNKEFENERTSTNVHEHIHERPRTNDANEQNKQMSKYIDDNTEKLRVANIDDVVEIINENIVEVPENIPENKEKKDKQKNISLPNVNISNKYILALAVILVLAVIGGLYYYFRHRSKESDTEPKDKAKPKAKTRSGKEEELDIKRPPHYYSYRNNPKTAVL